MQLALQKGDAVFFNPAVMHAAGANTSRDIYRLANLLQISSAFGRAMEAVDRVAMALAVYPVLLEAVNDGTHSATEVDCVVAATAEGYAFPTNLDADPPVDGLAPDSQATLMRSALRDHWPPDRFRDELVEREGKRAS